MRLRVWRDGDGHSCEWRDVAGVVLLSGWAHGRRRADAERDAHQALAEKLRQKEVRP